MSDLKPAGIKAPLNLLPIRPLRAIAAAMEHGAVKYEPWNWQDVEKPQAEINELYAALLRHTLAASDPSENDIDAESGLHHIAHAGACVMLLLYKLGEDYRASNFIKKESERWRQQEIEWPKPTRWTDDGTTSNGISWSEPAPSVPLESLQPEPVSDIG